MKIGNPIVVNNFNSGNIPSNDNSSIPVTDKINAFVRNNNRVKCGQTFSSYIVSTYNIADTTAPRFEGGILDINGDVHLAIFGMAHGVKIAKNGVVSTYTVPVTTGMFWGGVLSPNGCLYFGSNSQVDGVYIDAHGIAQSVGYPSGSCSNRGGAVAPDGTVYFAPRNATKGLKIDLNGVNSTYALAYTTTDAYCGGVLSPNGDIHFIPDKASVGQRISGGVAYTYSLIHTKSGAYAGGVLDAQGNIHFVPNGANVGQKVDLNNVVSTYSITPTLGASGYIGGVLCPNGDIMFIPNGNVGKKISSTGVVSTFDTSAWAQGGGFFVDYFGDIHCVAYSGAPQMVTRISFNTAGRRTAPFKFHSFANSRP